MILTITLNPSIDMNYQLDKLAINEINRCGNPTLTAGGKGLNVTRVIHQNNESVLATGFLGGLTGIFIRQQLDLNNILHDFTEIRGNTRHCLALIHEGNQTEVLENGPEIAPKETADFITKYKKLLNKVDVITASGSIPQGPGEDFYRKLIDLAHEQHGKKFILDTSGNNLAEGIKAKPYLIKPNQFEVETLLDQKITSEKDLIQAIRILVADGPENVVVSLGGKGSIAYLGGTFYKVQTPRIHAVSAVGSGDSMIAGLALGTVRGYAPEKVLAYASTFGTLNAMEKKTGFINTRRIDEFLNKVTITQLNEYHVI